MLVQKDHRGKYDVAVSRAVAAIATLSEYCLPLVKYDSCRSTMLNCSQGFMLAQKGQRGPQLEEELNQGMPALELLGGKLIKCEETKCIVELASNKEQTSSVVIIEKCKETPLCYPRRVGLPKKRPLTIAPPRCI